MGQPGPHQVAVTHDLSYIFMDVLLYWQLCFEEQVAAFYWSLDHLVVHCVPLCELQKKAPFPRDSFSWGRCSYGLGPR